MFLVLVVVLVLEIPCIIEEEDNRNEQFFTQALYAASLTACCASCLSHMRQKFVMPVHGPNARPNLEKEAFHEPETSEEWLSEE